MRFPPYDWSALPSLDKREYKLKILRAPAGGWADLGCLSEQVTGVWLHWNGKRNVGCVGKDHCEFCKAGKGRKWRGYLAVLEQGVKYVRLLEVTPEQLQAFLDQNLDVAEEGFRGLTLRVDRTRTGKKTRPILRRVSTDRVPTHSLRLAPDVPGELHRIWSSD